MRERRTWLVAGSGGKRNLENAESGGNSEAVDNAGMGRRETLCEELCVFALARLWETLDTV